MTTRLPAEWLQIEPLEQAHALPAPFYTDPALYQAEQGLVFGRSWQLVAHVDALREPGDHIVTEVAGKPIIVVRGQDGELRGFHNVCRHRAGPLALCDGKGAKALHCKYHGWTYTLDGQLRSAPEMQGACDFQVSDIRLPSVRVAVWAPLVFVSLSDDAPPFEQLFAGISERVAPNRVQTLRFHNRISYDIACNWKVYVDNFLEGYHLPHVHPGLSKLLDYRSYQTELAEWHSLQYSPLDDAANFYGDGGGAFYYFIYPNIMLNCLPGRMQTNRIVPLAVDRCRVEFDYYYPVATDADELARRQQDQQFSHEIQDEDIGICLAVQKGLQSGSYHAGRLCPKREAGVKHFQDLLKVAYRHLL